jgi:hypothetical protein
MDEGPAASSEAQDLEFGSVPQTGASIAGFVVDHADTDHLLLRAVERASAPSPGDSFRLSKRGRAVALGVLALGVATASAFATPDLLVVGLLFGGPLPVAPWLLDADNAARAGVLSIARRSIEAYRVRPAEAAYRGASRGGPLLLVDGHDVGEVQKVIAVDASQGPGTSRLYNVEIVTADSLVIATRVERRDEAEEVVLLLRGALGLPSGDVWHEAGHEHLIRMRVVRATMWLTGAALVVAAVALARAWAAEPVARFVVGAVTGAIAGLVVPFVARAGGGELRRTLDRDRHEALDADGAGVTPRAAPRAAARTP